MTKADIIIVTLTVYLSDPWGHSVYWSGFINGSYKIHYHNMSESQS